MFRSAKRGHALARVRIDAGRLNAQSGQYCRIFGPIPDERFEVSRIFLIRLKSLGCSGPFFRPVASCADARHDESCSQDPRDGLQNLTSASSLFRLLSSGLVAKKVTTK